jgi:DNA-binding CsgD family transcriptional regulator
MLVGREDEQRVLTDVLSSIRAGHSAVTVVRGEPGIGKTALLDWIAGAAAGIRVIRATGVQKEMDFSFGALHQILSPLLDHLGSLPPPQRRALQVVLALDEGPPPDRYLVYLSAMTLITTAALDQPLLLVTDDAQWLDHSSREALAFVARRILADPVACVFGLRADAVGTALDGLPVLDIGRLSPEASHELLLAAVSDRRHRDLPRPVALHYDVARRIVAEAGGNPLAIQEFGAELVEGSLAAAAPLDPLPLTSRLESRFLRLVRDLPDDAQTLLLVAACEPAGEPGLVLEAAGRLGVSPEAADVVQQARLITVFPTVEFRHPLVRSAVHGGAPLTQRRRVHQALAEACHDAGGADMRAWHRGAAAAGPDEAVAAELEALAGRARSRGGYAAEASFLARAADLTPAPAKRGSRLLAASAAAAAAGSHVRARELLGRAQAVVIDRDQCAFGRALHGLYLANDGRYHDSAAELFAAAQACVHSDPAAARLAFLGALTTGIMSSERRSKVLLTDIARAALASKGSAGLPCTMADLLLDGVATRLAAGYEQAAPILARAIRTWQPPTDTTALRSFSLWSFLGYWAALDLWDFEALEDWNRRIVKFARTAGVLPLLRNGLHLLRFSAVLAGRFSEADRLVAESEELDLVVGGRSLSAHHYVDVFAARGQAAEARSVAGELDQAARATHFATAAWTAKVALTRLNIALGDYSDALGLAQSVAEDPDFGTGSMLYAEVVEAAVRTGQREAAQYAAGVLSARVKVSGAPWGRGLDARCRALLAPAGDAEEHYAESVAALHVSGARLDEVRSVLLYGEWLRRRSRRAEARVQLRSAFEAFAEIGAQAFAERARAELAAAGQRVPKAHVRGASMLTAQEIRVTELAIHAATKAEIAAKLYISANTVDYHLRNIYAKLGVNSRRGLARVYQDTSGPRH